MALEFVKKHPKLMIGGAVGVVAIVLLASRSGGGAVASTSVGGGELEAASAFQAAQMQQQGQLALAQLEIGDRAADRAFQLETVKLSALLSEKQMNNERELGLAGLNAQREYSSLQLANDAKALENSRAIQEAGINAQVQLQQISANSLLAITKSQTDAQVKLAKEQRKSRGLFSKIFG